MKRGIDYFPLDVDFFEDDKIMLVSSKFGVKGEIITIRLLARIYKTNGYFMRWDEDTALLFAKTVGLGEPAYCLVNDVVQELARRGFFNEEILGSFDVLTSHGIQERYLKAVERRKTVEMIAEYCLVQPENYKNLSMLSLRAQKRGKCKHDANISAQNVNISGENAPNSKVENSKRNNSSSRVEQPEETTTTTDEILFKNKNLFEQCQEILGGSIPAIKAMLVPYLGIMEEALIMRSVEKAASSKAPSWNYAKKLLKRWKEAGILTLEDQDQEQKQYNDQKYPEPKKAASDIYIPRDEIERLGGGGEG